MAGMTNVGMAGQEWKAQLLAKIAVFDAQHFVGRFMVRVRVCGTGFCGVLLPGLADPEFFDSVAESGGVQIQQLGRAGGAAETPPRGFQNAGDVATFHRGQRIEFRGFLF